MTLKLTTSLVALTAAVATPALADVTAADVWSNQQSLYAAMGGTLSGKLSADGTVRPELNFILPNGLGSLQVKVSPITLSENNNGSVTITYPSPTTFSIAGGIASEGSFTTDLTMTSGDYTSNASGDADDITYETSAADLQIDITDLTIDSAQAVDFSATGTMKLDELSNTSRVTVGDLVNFSADYINSSSSVEVAFTTDNVTSTTVQNALPLTGAIVAAFPAGGSNVMNLSQALRDGLSIAISSTGEGNSSSSLVTLNGDVLNSQETTNGSKIADLTIDENGIALNAEARDVAMSMNDPLLFPAPLEFAVQALSATYDIPVNASEKTQDFRLATSLQGLTVGDTLWGLIDPTGQLPRDPAEISFDITGLGTNGMDLLDFAAFAQVFGPPPIQVDQVTIENLNIAAAGADVSAQGAMTFDWTDFQTFAGMPRPEGAITINLNGANALMDTLVAMGLLPAEDLLMPRMMMGMFATPVGDDQLETVIEVNSEGHLLANGQRLQ